MSRETEELEARFWSQVDFDPHNTERCWPWIRGTQYGYGFFHFTDMAGIRVKVRSHRLAYVLTFGEIPTENKELQIDHLCHDPESCQEGGSCPHRKCCNPHHLRLSTGKENGAPDRMVYWQTLKTHCRQGHEYSPANTAFHLNGHRYCRTCNRERQARIRAQRRQT